MPAQRLKIAPTSRFIRVWRSDAGHNHWISDGPTPGQRLADTIESIAEPPLTVLSFEAKPLVRKRADGRLTVYSVGPDGEDDVGLSIAL